MNGEVYYLVLPFQSVIILTFVDGRHPLSSNSEAVEGRRTEIVCKFEENIVNERATFKILKYDSLIIPELVLSCTWPSTGDVPQCVTRSGYEFDPFDVHTTVRLIIPYTSCRHAGRYNCQSLKHGVSTSSYNHTLHVVGTTNSCTAGRVTEGERSTIACHFNQNLNVTKGSFALRKIDDGDHKTVLACNWAKHGSHVCAHNGDYDLTSAVTHSVAISIQRTGPQHGGTYRCIVVPEHKWVTSETCLLEVSAAVTDPSNTSTTSSRNTTTPVSSSATVLCRTNVVYVLIAASVYFVGVCFPS